MPSAEPPTHEHLVRPLRDADRGAVVELGLRAWAPVFASFEQVLGPAIYRRIYPDWAAQQRAAIEESIAQAGAEAWVADARFGDEQTRPAGFMTLALHGEDYGEPMSGEIEMIAVDPAFQRQGIAAALIAHAVQRFRDTGRRLAVIATGGDPGHAPARAAYEAAGFTALPQVRYYLDLDAPAR